MTYDPEVELPTLQEGEPTFMQWFASEYPERWETLRFEYKSHLLMQRYTKRTQGDTL